MIPARPLLSTLAGDAELEALLFDNAQLTAILRFESALAEAEAEAGLISDAAADAISAAIESFKPDWSALAAGMARDGVLVPALVAQLKAQVGEPHAAAVHKGATSQDAVDTALMLQLAQIVPIYVQRLVALETALRDLSRQAGTREIPAHTRMQVALPFTFADKIETWTQPLERHRQALSGMLRSLLVVQLGGPIGNRASFDGKGDDVARFLAKRLDLGIAEPWHATRDPLVAFASRLALITGSLGKLGMDIALLAQTEAGWIKLSGGGGSSSMAHKSNPVRAEVLVALARFNAGLEGTLQQAMVHENERSGAAWTLEWLVLPQILITTGAALRLAHELIAQVER